MTKRRTKDREAARSKAIKEMREGTKMLGERGGPPGKGKLADGRTPLSTSDESIRAPSTTDKSIGVDIPQASPRVLAY